MRLHSREIAIALALALLVAAASWFGLSRALGAHPWWAAKSGLIGGALGFILFLAARAVGTAPRPLAIVAIIALIAAETAAFFGKSAFVSAEEFNAAAGRIWYFGWITAWAALALLLSALAATRLKGSPR